MCWRVSKRTLNTSQWDTCQFKKTMLNNHHEATVSSRMGYKWQKVASSISALTVTWRWRTWELQMLDAMSVSPVIPLATRLLAWCSVSQVTHSIWFHQPWTLISTSKNLQIFFKTSGIRLSFYFVLCVNCFHTIAQSTVYEYQCYSLSKSVHKYCKSHSAAVLSSWAFHCVCWCFLLRFLKATAVCWCPLNYIYVLSCF